MFDYQLFKTTSADLPMDGPCKWVQLFLSYRKIW